MNKTTYISQRKMSGIKPNGDKIEITIAVGKPYEDSEYGSWACPVKVDGLHRSLADMHGIDSWQALREAQKLVRSVLTHFLQEGGELYIFGEEESVSADDIQTYF